jgi:hypothetical protein
MTWLNENAAAISAIGSVGMNISTLIIIFFSMNQIRLNRHSVNIDINFKVFDLRKTIYREIVSLLQILKKAQNFSHLIDDGIHDRMTVSEKFKQFKHVLEDSTYLFSPALHNEIQNLVVLCENGIATEIRVSEIKAQDVNSWTAETTSDLQELSSTIKNDLEAIFSFDVSEFIKYLNVSDFHLNFIAGDSSISARMDKFRHLIFNSAKATKVYKALDTVAGQKF